VRWRSLAGAGRREAVLEAEEHKALASLPQLDDPRLGLLQPQAELAQDRSQRIERRLRLASGGADRHVRSARGAVAAFRPVRLPEPPPEPDVPVSEHPALHRPREVGVDHVSPVHGEGIAVPL
jgi:hypothetical protein